MSTRWRRGCRYSQRQDVNRWPKEPIDFFGVNDGAGSVACGAT